MPSRREPPGRTPVPLSVPIPCESPSRSPRPESPAGGRRIITVLRVVITGIGRLRLPGERPRTVYRFLSPVRPWPSLTPRPGSPAEVCSIYLILWWGNGGTAADVFLRKTITAEVWRPGLPGESPLKLRLSGPILAESYASPRIAGWRSPYYSICRSTFAPAIARCVSADGRLRAEKNHFLSLAALRPQCITAVITLRLRSAGSTPLRA